MSAWPTLPHLRPLNVTLSDPPVSEGETVTGLMGKIRRLEEMNEDLQVENARLRADLADTRAEHGQKAGVQ